MISILTLYSILNFYLDPRSFCASPLSTLSLFLVSRELADVDKDGRLSTAEFCIAMHLSEKAKKGLSIPPNLPPELLKEAKAGPSISSSKSTENIMTLEDKRRANWEEGQRKLESIRQEIREKQEKEKVWV